jgi:hypothetical protein
MTIPRKIVLVLCLLAVSLLASLSVQGASVAPEFVAGNPTCQDLGYVYGFRINSDPASGSYTDPSTGVTIQIINNTLGDGTLDAWSATLGGNPFGIDAVTMKGGPNANVYRYNPEATSDTNLVTPLGAGPGGTQNFGISHVDFCFDFELVVSKDASTTFTRTYTWTITKEVNPTSHTGFAGDSFSSDYTVTVDRSQQDSDWAVSGNITIYNPDPTNSATITGVSDDVSGVNAPVNCGVTFPYLLAAGGTLACTYSTALPDGSNRINTATATTSGAVGGDSGTADVIFGAPTTVNGYEMVNVTDSVQGDLGPASGDDPVSFNYDRDFSCSTNPSDYTDGVDTDTYPNTATIEETDQSDDASVTVTCYAPVVSKTAETTYTRTWDWNIVKDGDQTSLTLSTGQSFLVNYTVEVSASDTDSDWMVSGIITVENPHPDDDMTVSVADSLAGAIINCGDGDGDTELVVPAGGSATCSYSAGVGGAVDGTNTATATLNEIDFSGSEDYTFGDPTTEIDECVDVTDDQYGALGTVCADESPKTFEYTLDIGPYDTCGEYDFVNVASFTTNDTGATGSDDHTVNVTVPCGECTLTQGYWKTHSEFGPAPYDDTWALLPNGASTPFFLSGKTWYQVFWTAPAGNVYYILAHQYMAARLNILSGATTTPAVDAAMLGALNFFNMKTPTSSLTRAQRNQLLAWATTLDNYNNGVTGPGHCSE